MLFDEGDDKMVKTEAFPTIRMKIDRLLKITNEYQFNDLVKAVYCINLCINNRSVLYNVSLLIDLYDIWENKIDFKEQISVANEGIIDRIYSLFEMDRSRSCSIFAPAMIFPEQKYDSSQRTYTFIANIIMNYQIQNENYRFKK